MKIYFHILQTIITNENGLIKEKTMKKLLIILCLFSITALMSSCDKEKVSPFVFVDYKDGVELYKYVSDDEYIESIDIPDEYNGKKVIRIEDAVFDDVYSIEKIKLPEYLEEIGEDVFTCQRELHLKNVPNTIKIVGNSYLASKEVSRYNLLKNNPEFKVTDDAVFSKDGATLISYNVSNDKTEYIIPNGVTTISENAFLDAKNLEKVIIPEGVKILEKNAFSDCAKLSEISFPKSLKHMESNSVSETKWYSNQKGEVIINGKFLIKEADYVGQKYKIPEGVTHLLCGFDDYYQDEESIENDETLPYTEVLTLPKSLEYISPDIDLSNVSLYYIEDGNENFVIDKASFIYNKDKTKLIRYANGAEINLVLDNNIKVIGDGAFSDWDIESIVLPKSLEVIERYAFSIDNLKTINIPNTIKTIEEGAFAGCYEMKECKIPDSVERIERYAYRNIKDLEITIPDSVKYIHPQAFDNSEEVKIIGEKGSFAEKYAEIFDYDFEEMD